MTSRRLSRANPPRSWTPELILDFDIETIAAGYADPQWVPDKITCWAASFVGNDEVLSRISTSEGLFSRPARRRKMLAELLEQIRRADMVTGHNLLRFDLKVIVAECMRLDLPVPRRLLVQDTMKMLRGKGFKKGQDNLLALLDAGKKLDLNWQEWQHAYEETNWQTVKDRCESDVLSHKTLREKMLARKWLKPPVWWTP